MPPTEQSSYSVLRSLPGRGHLSGHPVVPTGPTDSARIPVHITRKTMHARHHCMATASGERSRGRRAQWLPSCKKHGAIRFAKQGARHISAVTSSFVRSACLAVREDAVCDDRGACEASSWCDASGFTGRFYCPQGHHHQRGTHKPGRERFVVHGVRIWDNVR